MRLNRLLFCVFCLATLVFVLVYIVIASGREVAARTHHKMKNFHQMMSADHLTLLSLVDNLRDLSKQIRNIDTKNNETQKQILKSFNHKFDVHEHVLSYLQTQDRILKKEKDTERLNTEKSVQIHGPLCDDQRAESKLILSYSIFGEKAESLSRFINMVHNESINIYPYNLFTIRVYHDGRLSESTRSRIKNQCPKVRFCDIRRVPHFGDLSAHIGTVWRFLPMADKTVEIFCSRDLDSPLLQRGGDAVKEWLSSDRLLHVMRDRKSHMLAIMGGLWCFRPTASQPLGAQFFNQILDKSNTKLEVDISTRDDQPILTNVIWNKLRSKALQHDSYFCEVYFDARPFPTQRKDHFVGCVRNCEEFRPELCPARCRPKEHQDWNYC